MTLQKPKQQTPSHSAGPRPHVYIKAAKRDESDPSTAWEGKAKLTVFVVADEAEIETRFARG